MGAISARRVLYCILVDLIGLRLNVKIQ